jgi:hypothetical protein
MLFELHKILRDDVSNASVATVDATMQQLHFCN